MRWWCVEPCGARCGECLIWCYSLGFCSIWVCDAVMCVVIWFVVFRYIYGLVSCFLDYFSDGLL